jgi:hypothetical protein
VRLQLHALAYILANFMRTLALPEEVEHWSLTTLREKLVKIGARIVRHGRYVVFQLAEVAVPRAMFEEILRRIGAALIVEGHDPLRGTGYVGDDVRNPGTQLAGMPFHLGHHPALGAPAAGLIADASGDRRSDGMGPPYRPPWPAP